MVDLMPEGCVSLPSAFDLFHEMLWSGGNPVAELRPQILTSGLPPSVVATQISALDDVTNLQLAEFVRPFANGELEALVRRPNPPENYAIPPQEWVSAFFPERFFLASEVCQGHGDYWDAIEGRNPFVRRAQLDVWLSQLQSRTRGRSDHDLPPMFALRQCLVGLAMDGMLPSTEAEALAASWGQSPLATLPPPSKFNPMLESGWSLAMTVAWISRRNADAVRDSWTAFRTECWDWFPTKRKVPLDGGATWWVAEGEELRSLYARSVMDLGLLEALEGDVDAKLLSVKSAREDLWRKLAEGSITATAIDAAREAVQVPAFKWHYLELAGTLKGSDYVIQRSVSPEAAYTELTFLRSDVVRIWPPQLGGTSAPPFDVNKPDWTLWEAAQWVGCRGQALSSQDIADGNLDEKGAATLFTAMFDEKLGATGINQQRIRELIPTPYWEMATTDPEQFRQRHYVSFIDDILEDYGGQFTPYGGEKPRWFGIQVKRDALFAAFPEFSGLDVPIDAGVLSARPKSREADKLAATRQALAELFPAGPSRGLSSKDRLNMINGWHRKNGSSPVGATTVLRALKPQ
jgi:hypothetical protein